MGLLRTGAALAAAALGGPASQPRARAPAAGAVEPAGRASPCRLQQRRLRVAQEGLPDTFALGLFDTFMTSALSRDLSVLAGVVFEFGEDNTAVLDVEKVQLRWAPSTYSR
jgi:hypothetical protein